MNYQVRVMGNWQELSLGSRTEAPHESEFLVTACFPRGAEIAGRQLFAQQASLDRAAVARSEAHASMRAAAA
jgi:hypothetical protein